jgi:phenylalanine-4-hydroxylase
VNQLVRPRINVGDWIVPQRWERYTAVEHATWRALCDRQQEILRERACDAFLKGLEALDLRGDGIPDLDVLNETLHGLTGWTVVPVEGLVPDVVFFELLAQRRFPAGTFIRRPDQMDYLEEPDIFHDVFGHVPMLTDPAFADFIQAYGQAGVRAAALGRVHELARVYWYTVEFGLVASPEGPRIYGAGIASSPGESVYSLESPTPRRERFDLERVARTRYRTDDLQPLYFVIDSLDALLALVDRRFGLDAPAVRASEEETAAAA